MVSSVDDVMLEVLLGVVVAGEQLEAVTVDLDILSYEQVGGSDELHSVVNVLVLLPLEEGSLNDTRVLLSWLENGDGVVSQVERDNESPVKVLRHSSVELGSESEDFLVVVDVLEEVSLGLVWQQLEDVSQRVDLVSESVVRRDYYGYVFSWSRHIDLA